MFFEKVVDGYSTVDDLSEIGDILENGAMDVSELEEMCGFDIGRSQRMKSFVLFVLPGLLLILVTNLLGDAFQTATDELFAAKGWPEIFKPLWGLFVVGPAIKSGLRNLFDR